MTFSHDGLRDNATHLAAPPYFYENLKREIHTFQRNSKPFALLRFVLEPDPNLIGAVPDEFLFSENIESAAIEFSQIVESTLRREDLCARLGLSEFVLLVKGNLELVQLLSDRISSQWSDEAWKCLHSFAFVAEGDSPLELLHRLDEATLT